MDFFLQKRPKSGTFFGSFSAYGDVPKRLKGTVCKTVIRRFESDRRLFLFSTSFMSYNNSIFI